MLSPNGVVRVTRAKLSELSDTSQVFLGDWRVLSRSDARRIRASTRAAARRVLSQLHVTSDESTRCRVAPRDLRGESDRIDEVARRLAVD
jgi:hypothetical protein